MKFAAFTIASLIWVICPTQSQALSTLPMFLGELVAESAWMIHVKVEKIERPFEDAGNDAADIALCKVLGSVRTSAVKEPILWLPVHGDSSVENELKPEKVLLSLARQKVFSPMDEGGEYLVFVKHGGLVPPAVGSEFIYAVDDGKVLVYLADFPLPDTEIEDAKNPKDGPLPRRKIAVETFLKRIAELVESVAGENTPTE